MREKRVGQSLSSVLISAGIGWLGIDNALSGFVWRILRAERIADLWMKELEMSALNANVKLRCHLIDARFVVTKVWAEMDVASAEARKGNSASRARDSELAHASLKVYKPTNQQIVQSLLETPIIEVFTI